MGREPPPVIAQFVNVKFHLSKETRHFVDAHFKSAIPQIARLMRDDGTRHNALVTRRHVHATGLQLMKRPQAEKRQY